MSENKRVHGERIFAISGRRGFDPQNEQFYGDLTRLAEVYHYDHIIVLRSEKLSNHAFLKTPDDSHPLHLSDFHQQGKVGESSVLIADLRSESTEVYEDVCAAMLEDMRVFVIHAKIPNLSAEFKDYREQILSKRLSQVRSHSEEIIISFTQINPKVVGSLLGAIGVELGKMTDEFRLRSMQEKIAQTQP